MPFKTKLTQLGFGASEGPEPPERIDELERLIGVRIAPDYRRFLGEIDGGHLPDVIAPCTVPTPFGEHIITCLHTARKVTELLDSSVTPRNMVCIGFGHFGRTTCLSVAGHGSNQGNTPAVGSRPRLRRNIMPENEIGRNGRPR